MLSDNAMAQMNRLRDELDRVFGLDGANYNRPGSFPPVNVWEDENHFYLEAELPGMKIDELEIYVHDGDQLSLKGKRTASNREGAKLLRRERGQGEFNRSFKLDGEVDTQNVVADFKDGVLTVSLPKSESNKPRKVEINVGSQN